MFTLKPFSQSFSKTFDKTLYRLRSLPVCSPKTDTDNLIFAPPCCCHCRSLSFLLTSLCSPASVRKIITELDLMILMSYCFIRCDCVVRSTRCSTCCSSSNMADVFSRFSVPSQCQWWKQSAITSYVHHGLPSFFQLMSERQFTTLMMLGSNGQLKHAEGQQ